jgi:hypothetical protein
LNHVTHRFYYVSHACTCTQTNKTHKIVSEKECPNTHAACSDGWCWFIPREKYYWLVAAGWFILREKYCWLVADKSSEQGDELHFTFTIAKSPIFIVDALRIY